MTQLKKIYLGTNTKMYKTIQETIEFVQLLQDLTKDIPRDLLELFVLPSYTALDRVSSVVKDGLITYGSQNTGWEERGQFTGEISPLMLQETGAKMVMIGHSERRNIFHETDEEENKKVLCALKHGFTVLLCVGEKEEDKDQNVSDEILALQIKKGLQGVTKEQAEKVMIAYEPVWAIGVNGKPASKEYASERHINMRKVLYEIFPEETAGSIPLLYGGSVNPENATGLIKMDEIDGLFIGRSAWQADSFYNIIKDVLKVKRLWNTNGSK
jgi:triosephosphate isomerase